MTDIGGRELERPDWAEQLRERLVGLQLTGAREAEIVEELSQHLDLRYEELRRDGHGHDEARPRHGYEVAKLIEQRSEGVLQFHVASLYPLLYRMEKRGWVSAEWRDSDTGRRRRCYKLTREGKKQLVPLRQQWRSFFKALDRLGGFTNAATEGTL